jgi:hypothetical protein
MTKSDNRKVWIKELQDEIERLKKFIEYLEKVQEDDEL